MSWRVVVISSIAKLGYKMDYLVVRNPEGTKRIHLSEISVLMIESTAVSLTAYLLCELAKRKIDVVFCDEKRLPMGNFLPIYGSNDTSLKFRRQIKWKNEIKDLVWEEIVRAKITGQAAILKNFDKNGTELLESYIRELQPGDDTNREGHAAKVYFNSLFGIDFSRGEECAVNAALNYVYSIILSEKFEPIELSKKVAVVSDIFNIDFSSKKILTKINQSISENFSDNEKIFLNEIGYEVISDSDFDLQFSEIENFYQSVFYNKFKVLLLESFQREIPLKDENTVIIDKDLCEIC